MLPTTNKIDLCRCGDKKKHFTKRIRNMKKEKVSLLKKVLIGNHERLNQLRKSGSAQGIMAKIPAIMESTPVAVRKVPQVTPVRVLPAPPREVINVRRRLLITQDSREYLTPVKARQMDWITDADTPQKFIYAEEQMFVYEASPNRRSSIKATRGKLYFFVIFSGCFRNCLF